MHRLNSFLQRIMIFCNILVVADGIVKARIAKANNPKDLKVLYIFQITGLQDGLWGYSNFH